MIWETVLVAVHVLVAAALVGLVLLQHGKGADMGAAFGSGSSGSLFGAAGSANFLSRTTAILATVFFLSSLGLTYFGATRSGPTDIMKQGVTETVPAPAAKETKASDVPKSAAPTTPTAPPKETDSKPSDIPK
ncbi:MAG: preprotein translocase subunit SecG [Betaproteobacteria bacterium]|nr:MAG: preprotein translocase subunit SecG [Betaproteobacteria bacterium]